MNTNIQNMLDELTSWRQYIHQNPEIAFEEYNTSKFVKDKLESFGISTYTGFAKTGVVGVLKKGTSQKKIGFRADMDALPIQEMGDCNYKSTNGKMHACGHDGHTTILLGTAKYLAQYGNFNGTVYFYFQPAEEGGGGAKIMIEDGLFEKFPPDEIYALHNFPTYKIGSIAYRSGPVLASCDNFSICIQGIGGHAALPHLCKSPIKAAISLSQSLQDISSQINPLEPMVLSITQIQAGNTFNVIPDNAIIKGTVRTIHKETQNLVEKQIKKIAVNFAKIYDIEIQVDYQRLYPPTINETKSTQYAKEAAIKTVGKENVPEGHLTLGSEDFSFMLEKIPGSMVLLGNGDSYGLHHPKYNFNDKALPYGIEWFTHLAEDRLKK